mgnify:CR=1 FL=1
MSKKQLFGIGYVSIWVVIWGTLGSLVDLPFLKAGIYVEGSIGQGLTFLMTAIFSILVAVWLYPKVISSGFLVGALGLDTDKES